VAKLKEIKDVQESENTFSYHYGHGRNHLGNYLCFYESIVATRIGTHRNHVLSVCFGLCMYFDYIPQEDLGRQLERRRIVDVGWSYGRYLLFYSREYGSRNHASLKCGSVGLHHSYLYGLVHALVLQGAFSEEHDDWFFDCSDRCWHGGVQRECHSANQSVGRFFEHCCLHDVGLLLFGAETFGEALFYGFHHPEGVFV
jgi:hypothetical protein